MGGDASVFRDYDLASGIYRTRGLTAGSGITITENDNDIEIAATGGGANMNISIVYASFDGDGHKVIESPEVESVLYFRSGLFVGIVDPADSPVDLIEKSVSLARDVT